MAHNLGIGATEALLALWTWDGDVYGLGLDASLVYRLHRISGTSVDSGGWPVLVRDGFIEGTVDQGLLYLWHGQDQLSTVNLASGSSAVSTAVSAFVFEDVAVTPRQT